MTTFNKLLCAIDFSEGSDVALRAAVRLATRFDAELVIAHALYTPVFTDDMPYPTAVIQQLRDQAVRGLESATREAAELGAKRVSSLLLNGMPWAEVIEHSRVDRNIDLVVVGTHGRTGIKRFLLGSVAERIVRNASCSVIALHSENALTTFGHVLCPVDFSASSRHAAELATTLVEPSGRGVVLAHSVELPLAFAAEAGATSFLEDLEKRARRKLDEWAVDLRARTPAPITTRALLGSAAGQVLAALDEDRFDLAVLGSHGRTGITRLVLGSVAEKVVRHATCPVLVARSRAD